MLKNHTITLHTIFTIFQAKKKKYKQEILIKINNQPISHVKSIKFLGYVIDEDMSWKQHIRHISNKLSQSVGILKKSQKNLVHKHTYSNLLHIPIPIY